MVLVEHKNNKKKCKFVVVPGTGIVGHARHRCTQPN